MNEQSTKRLGRGLSGLIGSPVSVTPAPVAPEAIVPRTSITENPTSAPEHQNNPIHYIEIAHTQPNKNQPREEFDNTKLVALAESIKSAGVMQPVVVRKAVGGGWELVAGERRLRAARMAGLDRVPAVVVDVPDQVAATWAVVENVQRADLSTLEKSRAYKSLSDKFGMTHAEISKQVGEDRSVVTHYIRILELEEEILAHLRSKHLAFGHAKALLGMEPGMRRMQLAREAAENHWSVRQLESAVAEEREATRGNPVGFAGGGGATGIDPRPSSLERRADMEALETRVGRALGTKVRIKPQRGKQPGEICLQFYSLDHFDGLMQRLGVDHDSGAARQ